MSPRHCHLSAEPQYLLGRRPLPPGHSSRPASLRRRAEAVAELVRFGASSCNGANPLRAAEP